MNKAELIAALAAYPDDTEIVFDDRMGYFRAEVRPVTVRELLDPRGLPPYQDEQGLAVLKFPDRFNRSSEAGPPFLALAISEAS